MLHFQYLEYLSALIGIPVAIYFFLYLTRWKKKTVKKIGDPELVQSLISQYSPRKFTAKFIITIAAFILCAFALAGLVLPDKTQRLTRNGTDLMIALDVSKSMLANDIKPNRLERAKQLVSKVIDNLPEERVGLVIFAGRAYLQMPMTIDKAAAKMYISAASTNDVPVQGTVLSNALQMSATAFNPKDRNFKSILLITDGEDHDPDAEKVARELAKEGIMVNTIGIGTPTGSPIPDEETGQYKIDKMGNTVISRLNEKTLQNIAGITRGTYQHYSNPDMIVKNLKNQLAKIEQGDMLSDSSYLSMKQYYWYFLAGAFILLIAEMFISEKKRKLQSVMTMVLLMIMTTPVTAQQPNELILKGNNSFNKGEFEKASEQYKHAISKQGDNDIANYNLGNSEYRLNKPEEAIKNYDNTIQHTGNNAVKQHAYYNKGVVYHSADKLDEAIVAYKNALLLNPGDEDARQNLQRALQRKQQQNQNQNQEQKNQQNNKQNQSQQKPQTVQKKPANITQKEAEARLKALADRENELQDKLHKMRSVSRNSPEKDW